MKTGEFQDEMDKEFVLGGGSDRNREGWVGISRYREIAFLRGSVFAKRVKVNDVRESEEK